MSWFSSWRTALRVARREARRSKGRSILVIAMIAAPVLCLSFAAVTYDMFNLTAAEKAERLMGASQARIQWPTHQPMFQTPDPYSGSYGSLAPPQPPGQTPTDPAEARNVPGTQAELLAALPPGSSVLPVRRGTVDLRTVDGIGRPNAIAIDATDPAARGYVSVLEGRAPATPTEVALTQQAMDRLGAGIGGKVVSGNGAHTYTVVGRVEFPSLLAEVVLFAAVPLDAKDPPLASNEDGWLVTTPNPVTWDDVKHYNSLGMVVASKAVYLDPPPADQIPNEFGSVAPSPVQPRELGLGILVFGIAVLEIVLLAGPAFAVSARRRQRQLALVAANGGTAAHVRRIVLADGVVLGLVGAVIGTALGIAAAFTARPWVEELVQHSRAGAYRVFPVALLAIAVLAVLTGVLAALVPAFVTARQNIISSLAGRRGVTRSRKRWIVVGIAMVAVGTAIVVYGSRDVNATTMLAGLVLGELGLVFCTPALVGLVAKLGPLLPLGPRIALRDAARNRASAAPAISAVMAAVASSVAIGLYFDSSHTQQRSEYVPSLPTGYVSVYVNRDPSDATLDGNAVAEAILRSTLPIGEAHQIRAVSCPTPATSQPGTFCDMQVELPKDRVCPYLDLSHTRELTKDEMKAAIADPRCSQRFQFVGGSIVDDGTALATFTGASGDDLARARATLRAGGIVVRDPAYVENGQVTVAVINSAQQTDKTVDPLTVAPRMSFPAYVLTTGIGPGQAIISPGAVARAQLTTMPSMLIASTTRMPTRAEEDRLQGRLEPLNMFPTVEHGPPTTTDIRLWILMAAAAAVTLGAAGIGTGLAAADGRQDLSTLAAVGASPGLRRRLSLSQSGVIAGLGSILGAAAGVGVAVAIVVALNQRYVDVWPGAEPMPIVVPWLSLGIALIVVPAIAVVGAGSLTRSRLPIERRL